MRHTQLDDVAGCVEGFTHGAVSTGERPHAVDFYPAANRPANAKPLSVGALAETKQQHVA